jgi:hypothetical protein
MGRQHHLVFAFVGTGGDPHRALQRLPLPRSSRALQQLGSMVRSNLIEPVTSRSGARPMAEALGLGFGLHGEQAHFQHRPGQLAKRA